MSDVAKAKTKIDCEPLKKLIREVPDFPKPGILFYDITTLLKDRKGLAMLIDALAKEWSYFFPPSGGKVVYCLLGTS